MKSLHTLLAAVLLCVAATACGGTSKGVSSTPSVPSNAAAPGATPPGGYLKSDGDDDKDDGVDDIHAAESKDTLFPVHGKAPDRSEKRAITTLIKRYYAAAAAGDGAAACPLLYSTLATGLAESQGPSTHNTDSACATVMSALFERQRQQLAADDVDTMVVIGVGVQGNSGVATLGFRAVPVGEILLKRERSIWKMDALFDTGLT